MYEQLFLDGLIQRAKLTAIFLKNGIKLQGKILAHNDSALLISDTQGMPMLIFKMLSAPSVLLACSVADNVLTMIVQATGIDINQAQHDMVFE